MKHLLLIIVLAIIIFLVTYFNNGISNIDGQLNKKNINDILSYLDYKYDSYEFDFNEIKFESKRKDPKMFEYHAAVFLKEIDNLEVVRFIYQDLVYKYYFDDINNLFHYDLKNTSLFAIKSEYSNLKNDLYYLGNLKGIYRVYTKDNKCTSNNFLINYLNNSYYLNCYKNSNIVVFDSKYNRFTLNNLIDRDIIKVDDLSFYNIHLIKE